MEHVVCELRNVKGNGLDRERWVRVFSLRDSLALAKALWNGFPLAKRKYILRRVVENMETWFC